MAHNFKNINYGRLLYEGLRNYYSVNAAGQVSILFKFLYAIVLPMQAPFDLLDSQRIVNAIVANCKWQIGQLTNVLNYLYDNTLNRIFITQSSAIVISATGFAYLAIQNISGFGGGNPVGVRGFLDQANQSTVIINVPASTNISELTATVEQIRLQGIAYQIVII